MKNYTLITGASSGLGKEFAIEYAKKKQNLILVARRFNLLQEIKAELDQSGIDILIYELDLNERAQIDAFLKHLSNDIFIDRLINNAGFGDHAPFEEQNEAKLSGMIGVNIDALTYLSYRLIPFMKEHKKGEILNVASVAAFLPGPYMAEYYASKAYVLSLSIALREELKAFNISVSALCPGPTETEFFKVAKNTPDSSMEMLTMSSRPVVLKGIRDLEKNKAMSIPGFSNKVMVFLSKFVSRSFAASLVKKIQETKH